MADRLPLFPLGTVLLPGVVLPLHVFEPRYRDLVHDLLEQPEGPARSFGVVSVRAGHEVGEGAATALASTGCVAEVRALQPYSDGRYDVVGVGTRRFQLLGLDDTAGTRYLTGRVEWLGEPVSPEAADGVPSGETGRRVVALVGAVSARLRAYLQLVTGAEDAGEAMPGDPVALSYLVAAQLVLDRADRLRLLEAPDAVSRLRLALGLLAREQALVSALGAVPGTDIVLTRGWSGS